MNDAPKPPPGNNANRLGREKSPYLLQHAHNPVDWFPWSEEAFAAAEARDVPIFLSIGYSTCHWCHVMERESFEDPIVASLMNDAFVNVKVDREERPDVDQMYMTVCQMMTGSGGWPLTILMTPDRRPFFAATYIPRTSRMGRMGMLDLVPRVQQIWNAERGRLTASADEIIAHLGSLRRVSEEDVSSDPERLLTAGYRQLADRYDARHGGFGTAPKFPSPHQLVFLSRYGDCHEAPEAERMVGHTLAAMRRGGIFDQLGYGFHRYSTDAEWRLPHFEKMLYDQAMHVLAITEAYQRSHDPALARTADEIMTYVARDMRTSDGGFCSAEDADSEGEEGRFYVWTLDELRETLDADDAEFAARVWGCTADGNFVDEATGRRTGANVLMLTHHLGELPAALGLDETAFEARYESVRERLLAVRNRRVRPLKDDKVLTDWNGLMAAAAARAGAVFGRHDWIESARRALEFVTTHLRSDRGELMHRYRDGEVAVPAFLDDIAFLLWAQIELYDATLEPTHLLTALELADSAVTDFWNDAAGGFHFTSDRHERLPVRHVDASDGAMPSGNSVMAVSLARLARLTGRVDLETRAADTVRTFRRDLERMPSAHTHLLQAVLILAGPATEVVLVGDRDSDAMRAMLAVVRRHAPPWAVVLMVPPGAVGAAIREAVPSVAGHDGTDGRATAYVCRDFACDLPTTDLDELVLQLESAGSSAASKAPRP